MKLWLEIMKMKLNKFKGGIVLEDYNLVHEITA